MQKIPTLFIRDEKSHLVMPVVNPGCEWVLAGEGTATRKWDGTCCLVKEGKLFKRYDGSKSKVLPQDFIPAEGADSHWHGWRPVGDGPEDKWHKAAWDGLGTSRARMPDGTYELLGPAVNRNPDKLAEHGFRRHGDIHFPDAPRSFNSLRDWLKDKDIEGLVFHHSDGRMAKIKGRDFGLKRGS